MLNEVETRAELIDPALKSAGWGVVRWRLDGFSIDRIRLASSHRACPCVPC